MVYRPLMDVPADPQEYAHYICRGLNQMEHYVADRTDRDRPGTLQLGDFGDPDRCE
jgi:hypothetical protein